MTSRDRSIAQRTFAVLWKVAQDGAFYETEEITAWLKEAGWPALFPGHCFTCHTNKNECPACVRESL